MKTALLVVFFLGCMWSSVLGCRDGWYDATIVETGCVQFITEGDSLTWSAAADYCNAQGSHLLEIFTEDQMAFVTELALGVADGLGPQSYWIGASDANRDGHWYWTFSLRDLEYSAWATDPVVGEDYAFLDPAEGYKWRAAPEAAQHRAVCQRDPDEPHCLAATAPIATPNGHVYATEGAPVTRIAFSSCLWPESVAERPDAAHRFWNDVRVYKPDVWLWLGDNMYTEETGTNEHGHDLNKKRLAYNAVRTEASYAGVGPLQPGNEIPVMATWDDHDYAYDNAGNEYACPLESQNEYVVHFNVPRDDPRHPEYPAGQQHGVYHSRMFTQPGTGEPGIHVIMLDARSGRDPTFANFGTCKGGQTRMLSEEQWAWLEAELARPSPIKIIASGVQVLPPTDQRRFDEQAEFCADGSHTPGNPEDDSWDEAIHSVGEDLYWRGPPYEGWSEVPQERARLLHAAQRSLNSGATSGALLFVSGDQHWAELMAKRLPESTAGGGEAQVVYEVTASGIFQNIETSVDNANRLRDRSCDDRGSGPPIRACIFPFIYAGKTYTDCTWDDNDWEWCAYEVDENGELVDDKWGYCEYASDELAQTTFTNSTHSCSGSKYHICTALGNYGQITVDFEARHLRMTVRMPEEQEEAYHEISF